MASMGFIAQRWISAAKDRFRIGLARAMLQMLTIGLVLAAFCFGFASGISALASKLGVVWALGSAAMALLVLAGLAGLLARAPRPAPAPPIAAPAPENSMAASEIAFLLGFVAIRSLLRQSEKTGAPPK